MSPEAPQQRRTTSPGEVVDAHVHLFAKGLLEEQVRRGRVLPPVLARALETGRLGRRSEPIPDLDPEGMAAWYATRLDEAGIAKAVVMSVFEDSDYMRRFVRAGAGRVYASCTLDPRCREAPQLLEQEIEAGFSGVKLLPVNRHFHLSDPACRPFFEKAAELGCPITVHYGVTIGPTGDLRYADPTDLSPVARDFPEITFVIAHFGAGYFSEVLRLAYQCDNVCVDSSGTNNWIDYDPHGYSLAQVFERALLALGPKRILFGTDSNTTAPYRSWIAYQQRRILEELGLGDRERDAVLRANAVRIFNLDEGAPR